MPENSELLNAALDRAMGDGPSVGAASAWWDGTSMATAEAGVTDLASAQPVTDGTLFATGSVAKLATALMVLQLVDAGRIGLDDPVVTHLPEFRYRHPDAAGSVSVRHLLSHSGGTPDDWVPAKDATEILALISDRDPSAQPGEVGSYSNIGYAILGAVIGRVTGASYGTNLQDRLIVPLGLTHTALLDEEQRPLRAAPEHVFDTLTGRYRAEDSWPRVGAGWEAAGSSLHTNAAELALIAAAFLTGVNPTDPTAPRILSPDLVSAAQDRVIDLPGLGLEGAAWGLGWSHAPSSPARHVLGHSGGTSAALYADADSGEVVVTLTNFDQGASVGKKVSQHIIGAPSGLPEFSSAPLDPEVTRRLVGAWGEGEGQLVIRREGDALFLMFYGEESELHAVDRTTFLYDAVGMTFDLAFVAASDAVRDRVHTVARAFSRG